MFGGSDSGAALLAVDAMAPGSPYRPALVSAANVAINEDGQPVLLFMPAAAGMFNLRYFYVTSLSGPLVLLVIGSRNGVPTGPAEQVTLDPAQPRQLVLLPAATFGSVDSVSLTPVDPRANGTYSNGTTLFGIDNVSLVMTLASPPPPSPTPEALASPPPEARASPPPNKPAPVVLASPPPTAPSPQALASPPPAVLASPPPPQSTVAGGAVSPPPPGQTPQQQPSPPPTQPVLPPSVEPRTPPPSPSLAPPPDVPSSAPPGTSPLAPPETVASPQPPLQPLPTPSSDAQSRALTFDDGSVPPGDPVPEGYGGNPGVSYGNGSNPNARGRFVVADAGPGGPAQGAAVSGNSGTSRCPRGVHTYRNTSRWLL